MKILLYGINYSPEVTSTGKYTGEMSRWLADQGHEVRVITAPPYYPSWKVQDGFSVWKYLCHDEGDIKVFRCPLYVPEHPTALKRLVHLASFSLSSSLAVLAQVRWKPDRVVLVAPTLFCAPQALLLAKLTGAGSVLHIQDYEVDALFGLGMAKGGGLKRFAFAAEKAILRAFDKVSTISEGMLKRARQKGVNPDNLLFFPNWSETERFRGVSRSPRMLERFGLDPGMRVLLYSGNIGEKQGLESVIEAAERLQDRPELAFLIVGEGAGKARLVELVRRKGLNNVHFAPLQPYEDLPALLASADCHLVIQKRGAADAVLPSKLTNILAVGGNAVITADPDTSLGLLCEEQTGIATLVEPESVDALVAGIERALRMPEHNAVASDYASKNLDKHNVMTRFQAEISSCG
ncbi:glycosyltransferase WbuB [Halomonas sp. M4R1S46]|uniref:glycosyltransferase WbuB n=1 Tax=Halomonas sp. M4R1S46 TaxID=2982692 RepID=UPI0021E3AC5B|nr:glycosyltransferase WbuB [Halomonas sp. M4R1S46]UYG06054.1 glycosyltransferase WbuB [Halomonas sp. M4R1S46]